MHLEEPDATLVDQLDLPRGQGLAVEEVLAGSAAARAGLKAHDILLEINGKPVPDDVPTFAFQLDDLKATKSIEALVLRKGKRETLKSLALPELR